jgi:putative tryptophan/tyrosine transport system substrate-binding protein
VRRREFITLLGSAAAASLPRTTRAQNAARTARIGYLTLLPPGTEGALTDGLNNLGWTEGQNITIDRRICSGDMDCLEKSAVGLAELKLDVIVAVATSGVQAVRDATTSIPIVMAATGDPVGQGFVASLARPGSRITGTSFDAGPEITTKQLQLILEVVPKASRIAVLWNPPRHSFVPTGGMRKMRRRPCA